MNLKQRINPWKQYEAMKKERQQLNLPPDKFLEEINKILKELDL